MSGRHDHPHGHHHHDHGHDDHGGADYSDLTIPDTELRPADVSRRRFLQAAGVVGAGLAIGGFAGPRPATAAPGGGRGRLEGLVWLNGDHHIHTQYSSDGLYTVRTQVEEARRHGVNWLVITDHGSNAHARIGVDKVNPDIVAARSELRDMLVFQGLEWNIPAAEHGTVFVAPNSNELTVLKEFEQQFDGTVNGWGAGTPANEQHAVDAIRWLGQQMLSGRTPSALFLANHPARRGIDSPHEIRQWQEADPRVAIGMEGAPGHQAASIPTPNGPGSGRGFYTGSPSAASFPGYPLESYRTFGGFDWMTAKVGGLWDSLLAEGRPWFITANSDAHSVWADDRIRPPGQDNSAYFNANGRYGDPVSTGTPRYDRGDFWPGYYSRTWVGAADRSYMGVMDALRAGRVWVGHGDLIDGLVVTVRGSGGSNPPGTLGEKVTVGRGEDVHLQVRITPRRTPNAHGDVPRLARVDLISGPVTGPTGDRDAMSAPATGVTKSFEVRGGGEMVINHVFRAVDRSFYLRLRGTDGNVSAPGSIEPRQDPVGNSDPWQDLWFYANPVFVDVV
ncbi:PHP domain-containing protein [Blastococcus mobilis]|uniref:Tat (Twin-arginine translocation) pathway signal sequence n=1 Tax=Blastococcus mobilis TaxID=1938746 RepID=A0A238ZXS1_9ACTN|nr:PHP domain-containing protein [Blastococcus mobilis]SNR87584.1 Tat (twin-arginine translocation) pathway signal sequence [Blastococcus mobilis]